ncbi:AraC family transcriptional regulator [Paenibacillus tritici]|uniref:AraC family transcriptional regulator n=1 Tax=Paenibacillus tritici TaxID=1873425 RepID=A0ABX2DS59_9BACL|nr:AraC family transcriptional regulator [Paenibacillus tritici]NQX47528.1 AraC family transcriptional regulator [Paenibacillus tritici]QUL55802.1 AraC family transcriptional regulator [Paenibacillus tritici]
MSVDAVRRIVFAQESGQLLPITLDSMGYNPDQEKVSRPQGYHTYHWLQTANGEGLVHFDNKKITLPEGSGILLMPGTPHRYESLSSEAWRTYYLTFGGTSARHILDSLGMNTSLLFRWESEAPLHQMLKEMLDRHDASSDMFSLGESSDAYRFLLTLNTYGQLHNNTAISRNVDKLQPLLKWMDSHYGDPGLGLHDLASQLGVSGRYLNSLFLKTFGLSPYAYFVRLRIRKSKELLVAQPQLTVKAISQRVGFRDVSHFVATFRKQSAVTPEQFRRLH